MAKPYMELILILAKEGDQSQVSGWLNKHGLTGLPMVKGQLVTGDQRQLERAFAVSLDDVELPFDVPIPSELQSAVESITLPSPRSYHV